MHAAPVNPLLDLKRNRRSLILAAFYATVAGGSFFLAYELRFDFAVPANHQADRLFQLPLVMGVKVVALILARQLGTLMTYFSVPDLARLFWAMFAASGVLLIPRLMMLPHLDVPRGVLLVDFMICFGALCAGRLSARLYRERLTDGRREMPEERQRIAIFGAGDAGAALAKDFLASPGRGFQPVMFFDDDRSKHGRLIHGIPVVGRPEMLGKVKDQGRLAKGVIAMPSASAKRIREIVTLCQESGLKVETLPSMEELASGRVKASRIRPVEVTDLLGRETVNLDSAKIRASIEGRCVLVTGAGGSIGSELCRQIAALNPKRLLMVEQCEGALFTIEQEMNELGFGTVSTPLVGDILDRERMEYIFTRYEPEVVFHAAAHKHVYLMERQPAEAIRNNVLGTRQLAQIAVTCGVEAFVQISTDKAINPTSVMGATKRLAEIQLMAIAAQQEGEAPVGAPRLLAKAAASAVREAAILQVSGHGPGSVTSAAPARSAVTEATGSQSSDFTAWAVRKAAARRRPTKFMAVRFGNVLGSSGSVIPIFKRQIANGGPVTVTHPEVTRYFMTIPEAVGLVLQSSVQGKGGEIFVLDMGQPVKIADLAKQMIELSGFRVGEDIEIKYTGLKPGEKLFEELQHHSETHAPTEHPRIMRFTTSAMFSESGVKELEQRLYEFDANELKEILRRLVPEYTPYKD